MFCLSVSVLPSGSCLRRWISSSDHRPALPPGSDGSHSVDFAGFCLRETMSSWNRSRRHRSIYDSVLRCPTASRSDPLLIRIDCRRRCFFSEL